MAARLIGLVLLISAISPTARALDYSVVNSPEYAILATGDILTGDRQRLERFITTLRTKPSTVYLSSPGGNLVEGIELGSYLRAHGFATRVAANVECASACVFVFIGGAIRECDSTSKIGVHMASAMFAGDYIRKLKEILITPDSKLSLDDKISLIVALNEQRAAKAAQLEMNYLIKMGVSLRLLDPITDTLQLQVHWLTRRELKDYNVVNTE